MDSTRHQRRAGLDVGQLNCRLQQTVGEQSWDLGTLKQKSTTLETEQSNAGDQVATLWFNSKWRQEIGACHWLEPALPTPSRGKNEYVANKREPAQLAPDSFLIVTPEHWSMLLPVSPLDGLENKRGNLLKVMSGEHKNEARLGMYN